MKEGTVIPTAAGTSGQVLTSNGAGTEPTFQVVAVPTGSVGVADLSNGTDGELITWDSAGVATTVPVGTATQVLTSNGTGNEPTFQAIGNAATVTTNANLTGGVTSVGNAATVVTNANLTGVVTSTGNATAIANKALGIAKLADGTDGEMITWNSSGVIATVAAGSAGEVLTSNGAGAAPTMQAAGGGGGSEFIGIQQWTSSGTKTITHSFTDTDTYRLALSFTNGAVNEWSIRIDADSNNVYDFGFIGVETVNYSSSSNIQFRGDNITAFAFNSNNTLISNGTAIGAEFLLTRQGNTMYINGWVNAHNHGASDGVNMMYGGVHSGGDAPDSISLIVGNCTGTMHLSKLATS